MSKTLVAVSLSFFVATLLQSLQATEAFHFYQSRLKIAQSQLNANKSKERVQEFVDWEGLRSELYDKNNGFYLGKDNSSTTPRKTDRTPGIGKKSTSTADGDEQLSRNQFFRAGRTGLAMAAIASWSCFPDPGHAKLYSENAANLERINNGDFSGGAVFNNNPTTDRGKKRRAMTGCKVAMSREEASLAILKRKSVISEKECNTMVMDGNTEFMLEALRNLDCPTCANGIGTNK